MGLVCAIRPSAPPLLLYVRLKLFGEICTPLANLENVPTHLLSLTVVAHCQLTVSIESSLV